MLGSRNRFKPTGFSSSRPGLLLSSFAVAGSKCPRKSASERRCAPNPMCKDALRRVGLVVLDPVVARRPDPDDVLVFDSLDDSLDGFVVVGVVFDLFDVGVTEFKGGCIVVGSDLGFRYFDQ